MEPCAALCLYTYNHTNVVSAKVNKGTSENTTLPMVNNMQTRLATMFTDSVSVGVGRELYTWESETAPYMYMYKRNHITKVKFPSI